ncbi:MFS general substrate transporter [Paraphaeosphaeria sporulosa]|uniref:MFS general substrate transporter n=1 Tax=Paraphaeosphaeria sporulosa TaxID=1460663 RepID=A0A177CSV5_9PLEO|nr:MFS general substrate transporter [Paraphaeosphaeria sporulosa]OAG10613.1 MFS general substrate transporter [Paraphaeosphaeria sporulosa]
MAGFFTKKAPEVPDHQSEKERPARKSRLGILTADTDEVPGSVILLSSVHKRNEPLGLQHAHARTSSSSLPSPYGPAPRSASAGSRGSARSRKLRQQEKKRTKDGKFILEPQPEDSANDPLNWNQLRRDAALISLGLYCMVGGGMTPVLAAGFKNVAETYDVTVPQVALTTGLYMLGLGLGSVVASPTAILWGKRPVYLVAIVLFCLASVWCAYSPSYASLVVARIVQGMAISPVECLPSATIAEIFFLHERAYRLGIYTLLLLGGKNLIPLVSAAIVQSMGWRWVFKIVAIVVAFCFFLIFFCVPETFWDRTPHARGRSSKRARSRSPGARHHFHLPSRQSHRKPDGHASVPLTPSSPVSPAASPTRPPRVHRVGFAFDPASQTESSIAATNPDHDYFGSASHTASPKDVPIPDAASYAIHSDLEKQQHHHDATTDHALATAGTESHTDTDHASVVSSIHYTDFYREAPRKSYVQSLKPWNGRLVRDTWFKVMIRPFILFAYPAVLWSSMVYALAVGWLIVLSESVAEIYQNHESYNFTPLQVGLVYVSPFVGGVLGTAVAGKISDIVVRFMARRNDGVYEPEFRLVMAIPIAISTVIGLMGFGWSAEERDNWIVPTVFFGVISFGCSLGSTTSVTFVVDSYRQYAGEALVTLNFTKNVLHGFIFSLFFTHWLAASGPKDTFIAVGGIQLGCMLLSIPMYIYGKRARMWTVRKNFMEKF